MSLWGKFREPAQRLVAAGALDEIENSYKLDQGLRLASARDAFLAGAEGWVDELDRGLTSNLLFYINKEQLINWVREDPNEADRALRAIWADDPNDAVECIRSFCGILPTELISGIGARTNLASILLMALGAERYPPFRIGVFRDAYETFSFDAPNGNLDEGATYGRALEFLDTLLREADELGIKVRHRLDAQSIVWVLLRAGDVKSDESDYGAAVSTLSSRKPIWLMALGRRSVHWESCFSEGIAAIGWDELGDLEQYQSRDELAAKGLKTNNSLACWQFSRDMQPGDVILVREGLNSLVGAGIVTSDYRFDNSRAVFKHVRDVDWQVKTDPVPLRHDDGQLPRKTLTNVSYFQYSTVWAKQVLGWDWDMVPLQKNPGGLGDLAQNLYLPDASFIDEISALLEDKKQVIFQGPPGTGKTFIAQAVARHKAGSDDGVDLVQFHPSYAYEDFVQGYRPCILDGGQPGFELRNGPLLTVAERARNNPDTSHILVIDEINRGNLAKVFGELYFLLEYRDSPVRLQYQSGGGEGFSLPDNLFFIGTMNTADRSIALVDAALRRRFYFVEFHPDEEPVRGVLRRWLARNAPTMAWVADVVERANKLLSDDRHAAIGPSYFMKKGLDETAVRRIWRHSVLPYIEERLFGEHERLQEFELARLRRDAGVKEPNDNESSESGPP